MTTSTSAHPKCNERRRATPGRPAIRLLFDGRLTWRVAFAHGYPDGERIPWKEAARPQCGRCSAGPVTSTAHLEKRENGRSRLATRYRTSGALTAIVRARTGNRASTCPRRVAHITRRPTLVWKPENRRGVGGEHSAQRWRPPKQVRYRAALLPVGRWVACARMILRR